MRLTVRAISSLLICLGLASCNLMPASKKKTKAVELQIHQRVFHFPYDNVWRAAQLALKYPIAINNMDHGTLETDYVKADDGFISPSEEKIPSSGIRYKIRMLLAKGRIDGKDSIRVTIQKIVEKKRDFFSEAEMLPSDGLEEKTLFYRIERELVIDEALKKATKK